MWVSHPVWALEFLLLWALGQGAVSQREGGCSAVMLYALCRWPLGLTLAQEKRSRSLPALSRCRIR